MSKEAVVLAKIAALKKNFDSIPFSSGQCTGEYVEPLLPRYRSALKELKEINPELYQEIPDVVSPVPLGVRRNRAIYEKSAVDPLKLSLEYILELNSNIRIGENTEVAEKKRRVFISHGRSKEWIKIQSFLERDLQIATLELEQEPNLGRTILQKLEEESQKCSIAIIVMTGEDILMEGEVRTRENVMHEIGYFQGKYGLRNIILLHENGVNIPSNIHGLVYISFPTDTAEATSGALLRELKVLLPTIII